MANADVIVKFGADTTELVNAFKKTQTEADGLGSKVSGSLSSIGPTMEKAGAGLSAGLTVPLMGVAAFAMKSASDVNGAMRSIARETGLTGPPLEAMKNSFKSVAATTPASLASVGDAMTTVIQKLHLTGPALEGVTKSALDMSRMMGTDVKATTEAVATSFTAFGVPAAEMQSKMDGLFVLFQKTGVPVTELTATMAKAAPIARAAGLSYEQTAAMMGTFSAAGLPARQSLSMLGTVINKFKEQGIDAGKGFRDLITRIKEGRATADDVKLLGTNFTKFSDAVKTGKFDYDKLVTSMKEGKGAIEATSKGTATFGEKMQMLRNKLEIAFAPLGTAIFDALGQLVDAATPFFGILTKIAQMFANLPAPIKMIIVVIGGILAALGPVLMVVGTMLPAITAIVGILSGPALAAILAFVAPFLLPIAIIAAIGIALLLLYTKVKPFKDAVDAAFGVLKNMADLLMKGDFGGAFNVLKNALGGLGETLKKIDWGGVANTIWTAITGTLGKIGDFLKSLDWGGFANTVWNALKLVLGTMAVWLITLDWGSYAQTVWNALKTAIGAIIGWIKSLDWGGYAQTVWNALKAALAEFGSWLIGLVSGIGNSIKNWIWGAVGGFGSWLINQASNIGSSINNWIRGALGGFGGWLISQISGIGSKIWSDIQSVDLPGKLGTALSSIGGIIVQSLKDFWNRVVPETIGICPLCVHMPRLAEGGIIGPQMGGVPVIAAEAGEREAFIPEHLWAGNVSSALLSSLPRLGAGGIVGGAGTGDFRSSVLGNVMTLLSRLPVRTTTTTSGECNVYTAYINVDSENIKRETIAAFQELEEFHHL